MNVSPVIGKLVLAHAEPESQIINGIMTLPKEYPNMGVVKNVSEGSKYVVNQKVFYARYGAVPIFDNLFIISETDVLAVVS